jgi:hypothetical protein
MQKKIRLTIENIEKEPPTNKERFIWDDRLAGFGLRVMPTGVKSFIIQYRNASGNSRRLTLGKFGVLTPDEARRLTVCSTESSGRPPWWSRARQRTVMQSYWQRLRGGIGKCVRGALTRACNADAHGIYISPECMLARLAVPFLPEQPHSHRH